MTAPTTRTTPSDESRTIFNRSMERLTKWRRILAAWKLGAGLLFDTGTSPKEAGGAIAAELDTQERLLIYRVELSALANLLVAKGVFTYDEFLRQVADEADLYSQALAQEWPGIRAEESGLSMHHSVAMETLRIRKVPNLDDPRWSWTKPGAPANG